MSGRVIHRAVGTSSSEVGDAMSAEFNLSIAAKRARSREINRCCVVYGGFAYT